MHLFKKPIAIIALWLLCLSTTTIRSDFAAGAPILTAAAQASPNLLTALLTVHPLVAPVTITVGGVGIIWAIVSDIKSNRRDARNKQQHEEMISGGNLPPEDPQKRRKTEKYHNMYEVFDKTEVGRILKDVSKPTKQVYDGAKVYELTEDVPQLGLKEGDLFYLDKLHGDHIEVLKNGGKAMRTVLNMDGTPNIDKLMKAGVRRLRT